MKNHSLFLNAMVAPHPCAVPFGQPAAEQKYSRYISLKFLTSNNAHGCTNVARGTTARMQEVVRSWKQEPRTAGSNLEQNRSSLGKPEYSRYLLNILCLQEAGKEREHEWKLRQFSQTKSPAAILNRLQPGPKGGRQDARNKSYFFMPHPD